jgi:hypothetical protein
MERRCLHCGEVIQPKPGTHSRPDRRYCDKVCAARAAAASRRRATERLCEQCGTPFTPSPRQVARGWGRFCSRQCAGAARHPTLPLCAVCKVKPVKKSWRQTCSRECAGIAHRRQVTRPCALCGTTVTRPRSQAPGARVFCKYEHYAASLRGAGQVAHACPSCGTVRHVSAVRLARGLGRFCNRRCFFQSLKKPRIAQPCLQCQQPMELLPSQRRRRYCSYRCRAEAHKPRSRQCEACGRIFWTRATSTQRFHSLHCAQRGRPHTRAAALVKREQWILALRQEGLKAPKIRERLMAMTGDDKYLALWASGRESSTNAAIRQIIWRAERAAAEKTVTLRT